MRLGEQTKKEKEEVAKQRALADIVVDPWQTELRRKVKGKTVFNNLDTALERVREGEKLFLEAGNYVSKSTMFSNSKSTCFHISMPLSIVGANMSTVVIKSNVVVKHDSLFQGGSTLIKNIKFMGDVEPQIDRTGLIISNGVDVVVEDCWFSGENCDSAKQYGAISLQPVAVKEKLTANEMKNGMDKWYPGIEFKNGTMNHTPAICTVRHCFLTNTIQKKTVWAVVVCGKSSLCTLEHSYIEGDVEVANEARQNIVNCHVMSITDNKKTNKSLVYTIHESSSNVVGSLFSSQKRSSEAARDEMSHAAIQYLQKTCGAVRNSLLREQETGIVIDNSEVDVEGNIFSSSDNGVFVMRKSPKLRIVSNNFNDCREAGIVLRDGAQPLVKSNKFNQSRAVVDTSSCPKISGNLFTGEDQQENAKSTGILYYNGGSGSCSKNTFINFRNPDQPPVTIVFSASQGGPGAGPKLMGNKFTNCVASNYGNYGDHKYLCVGSSEEEARFNSLIGDNVTRGNIRQCCHCKKTGSCDKCSQCKSAYYCDEKCQKLDWKEHQKYCLFYIKTKDK